MSDPSLDPDFWDKLKSFILPTTFLAGWIATFTRASIKLRRHDKILFDQDENIRVQLKSESSKCQERMEKTLKDMQTEMRVGMDTLQGRITEIGNDLPGKIIESLVKSKELFKD